MAQTRLRNYKHAILSFEHNIFNLGLHAQGGRYVGFDSITRLTALTFRVNHDGTGVSYKNQINQTKGPHGILLTPQGVIIMEDAAITEDMAIETNLGNAEYRYDIIICSHSHIVLAGGQAATYQVVKGPLSNPIKPVLSDPLKQTLIGVIEIPPNASDIGDCKYTKAKCPDSGDGEDARILDVNQFKALQQQNLSGTTYAAHSDESIDGGLTAKLWAFESDGNVFKAIAPGYTYIDGFRIKDSILQQGTRIYIRANDKVAFRMSYNFEGGAKYGRGYRALVLPAGLCNTSLAGGSSLLGVIATTGDTWEYEFLYIDGRWLLISIGGANSSSSFMRGHIIDWHGAWTENFDETGLGINLMAGWALCNGNNDTPDLRGKLRATATNIYAAGRPRTDTEANMITDGLDPADYISGDNGVYQGKSKQAILQANIPNYNLTVLDPGHQHDMPNSDSYPSSGKPVTGGQAQEGANLITNVAMTNIVVNSAGSGTPMPVTNPVYSVVTVMKL